jgi:hypothetical protein
VSIPIGRHQKNPPQPETAPGQPVVSPDLGIFYRSTVVSRKHAMFIAKEGRLYLMDCKSLGGTFVNSIRLAPASKESEPVPLYHGDILQFGVDYRPDVKTGQGRVFMRGGVCVEVHALFMIIAAVRNRDKCIEVRIEFPRIKGKPKQPKPPRYLLSCIYVLNVDPLSIHIFHDADGTQLRTNTPSAVSAFPDCTPSKPSLLRHVRIRFITAVLHLCFEARALVVPW